MNDHDMPPESSGPETDDSQNPTGGAPNEGSRVPPNLQSMLVQLQQMIDQVAVRSGPVLREVAAKAAELAAVAGEHAGPLAYKAAETTQKVGQRVADRSKVVAADLRRQQAAAPESTPSDTNAAEPSGGEGGPESGEGL